MKVRLCNKYNIDICDDHTKVETANHEPFFQHLMDLKRRKELSRFTWCWEKLVEQVATKSRTKNNQVKTVTEYFGGMGRSAVIIQNVLKPEKHLVIDVDNKQYLHLKELSKVYPGMTALQEDSFANAGKHPADFVTLDFNNFTLHTLLKNKTIYDTMYNVLKGGIPCYVEVADLALSKLQMNRDRYGGLVGKEIHTPRDYFKALSHTVSKLFGYGVSFVAHYGKLSAVLLEQDYDSDVEIVDARDYPESEHYLVVES